MQFDEHLKDGHKNAQTLQSDLVPLPPAKHGDPDTNISDQHFPTDEERATLRRVPEKLSVAVFSIGICELAERFSFYGATQVFTNFIARSRPKVDGEISASGAAKHLSLIHI